MSDRPVRAAMVVVAAKIGEAARGENRAARSAHGEDHRD
jgi:hypothetical protein